MLHFVVFPEAPSDSEGKYSALGSRIKFRQRQATHQCGEIERALICPDVSAWVGYLLLLFHLFNLSNCVW